MATPHVSGVAGLLLMYFPQCTNTQIRHAMLLTSIGLGLHCNDNTGYGMVQAKDAYTFLKQNCGGAPAASPSKGGCNELKGSSNYASSNIGNSASISISPTMKPNADSSVSISIGPTMKPNTDSSFSSSSIPAFYLVGDKRLR